MDGKMNVEKCKGREKLPKEGTIKGGKRRERNKRETRWMKKRNVKKVKKGTERNDRKKGE